MRANFTLVLLLVFLAATIFGWEWPYIAKLMPIYVAAIPGLILSLVQLYRDATAFEDRRAAHGVDMDEIHETRLDKKIELRRSAVFFAWFVGGALAIWLLGIVIALPLLAFLYTRVEGKERWSTCLIMTACTYLLIWGLFEYTLESRWPPGVLFQ